MPGLIAATPGSQRTTWQSGFWDSPFHSIDDEVKMIHPIAAKTCTEAWLRAASLLAGTTDRIAYNVILDIEQPIAVTAVDQRIVEAVDRFLKKNEADPVATLAAPIF